MPKPLARLLAPSPRACPSRPLVWRLLLSPNRAPARVDGHADPGDLVGGRRHDVEQVEQQEVGLGGPAGRHQRLAVAHRECHVARKQRLGVLECRQRFLHVPGLGLRLTEGVPQQREILVLRPRRNHFWPVAADPGPLISLSHPKRTALPKVTAVVDLEIRWSAR